MYEVRVEDEFAGAHRLRDYAGKCERLHGHNWKIAASVAGRKLGPNGLLIDFHDLRRALSDVLKVFDHAYLNDVGWFKTRNPSSENIARYVFLKLGAALKGHRGIGVSEVTVWENGRQSASYRKG